jgi:hypothetical protein
MVVLRLAPTPCPPLIPRLRTSLRRNFRSFRIQFVAAIHNRAQHAVMKVRQPQNMPFSVRAKLFR